MSVEFLYTFKATLDAFLKPSDLASVIYWVIDEISDGTQAALRRHSGVTRAALRRHSGGTEAALGRH